MPWHSPINKFQSEYKEFNGLTLEKIQLISELFIITNPQTSKYFG